MNGDLGRWQGHKCCQENGLNEVLKRRNVEVRTAET